MDNELSRVLRLQKHPIGEFPKDQADCAGSNNQEHVCEFQSNIFHDTHVVPPSPKGGRCTLIIPSGIFGVRLSQPNIGHLRRPRNTEFETDLWEERQLKGVAIGKANVSSKAERSRSKLQFSQTAEQLIEKSCRTPVLELLAPNLGSNLGAKRTNSEGIPSIGI